MVGKNRTVYPVKSIYALAIGAPPTSFNTRDAIRVLEKLKIEMVNNVGDSRSEFEKRVNASLLNNKARAKRLANRKSTKPRLMLKQVYVYDRNPDVVAEALYRAKGACEDCNSKAPFRRKSDSTPYLEVHHTQQLANGGDDVPENTKALCPNCHRKAHYG